MIETRVAGIPCKAYISHYSSPIMGQFFGPPENCCEAFPAEVEVSLCDLNGRPAPWLERKMTRDDELRIADEIVANDAKYWD